MNTDVTLTTPFPNTTGNQLLQAAKVIKFNATAGSGLRRQIFFGQLGGSTHIRGLHGPELTSGPDVPRRAQATLRLYPGVAMGPLARRNEGRSNDSNEYTHHPNRKSFLRRSRRFVDRQRPAVPTRSGGEW